MVDDVPSNRELLEESLSRAGFETRGAVSGEEALEVHREWAPDLVLMDLHMPGMGGLAAIRYLRDAKTPAAIVVTTAGADNSTEATVTAAGAVGLLRKPYRESELFETIARGTGVKFVEVRAAEATPVGAAGAALGGPGARHSPGTGGGAAGGVPPSPSRSAGATRRPCGPSLPPRPPTPFASWRTGSDTARCSKPWTERMNSSEAVPSPVSSILLVDDTPENLRLLAGMLAMRGFDARAVTSGPEALEAVANELPDLILLDVTMPGMTGFEVCARLRERPEWSDIPVIFLTALTDVSDKVKGFAAGGVDYITKPFQLQEVLARVTSQLALRRARRDLEQTIQQLREVEQLRDDLTRMIVHDMRSPLAVLIMQLELLRTDVTGEAAAAVDDATVVARQLNGLANTLLDVSRLEEGKMPVKKAPIDLAHLAGEVGAALSRMESGRIITLVAAGPVVANCDAGLVRRVIENLVSNGIKHTPAGAKLTIEVKALPGRVRVAVQDEGSGVPPEARQRIFEKFGAVAVRKDSAYHSVGLGLAFCKLAVEAHGGTIGVADAVPHGSIFAFELPT